MAVGKNSFILYLQQRSVFDGLEDAEAGKLIKTIFSYVCDENPQPTGMTKYAFEIIKPVLKADLKKYEEKKEKYAENIRKRWNKEEKEKIQSNTMEYNGIPSDSVYVNDNVNVNVNDNILSKDNELNNRDINISCAKEEKNESIFESFWKVYPRKIGKEKCKNWFKSHKPKEDLVKQMIEAVEQQKKSKQWSDPQYIPHPYTWLNQGRWEDELTPTKDSTFQSAPKNPIQWEEAKANTIDDDINLIRNNPDKAHQLLEAMDKINPERAKEIRLMLGYWKK
jgi:hypothetical protein